MKIYEKMPEKLMEASRGVALGFFDGIHLGHQELLRTLVYECQKQDLLPSVFSFKDHPDIYLYGEDKFSGYLMTYQQRLEAFEALGFQESFSLPFTEAVATIPALEFLENYLWKQLNAKLIVVGSDYCFGHKGQGNIKLLRSWCAQKNIQLIEIQDIKMLGGKISSTRIRSCLLAGEISEVNALLGRPYQLEGKIVYGKQNGSKWGFPTANMEYPKELVKVKFGVYYTRLKVNQQKYSALTNIGLRPTVEKTRKIPLLETYIYDFKDTIYGEKVSLELFHFSRQEHLFKDIISLKALVEEDMKNGAAWHQKNEDIYCKGIFNQIPLWHLPCKRFSQAKLQFVFKRQIEPENYTCRNLLLKVLLASSKTYPNREVLLQALDYLYGADLNGDSGFQGDQHVLTFSLSAHRTWLDGTSPFFQAVEIIMDCILKPDWDEKGHFRELIVAAEKQNLKAEILARKNEKAEFAFDESIKIYAAGNLNGCPALGKLEDLDKISLSDLKREYLKLIREDALIVFLAGDFDEAKLQVCGKKLESFQRKAQKNSQNLLKPFKLSLQQPQEINNEMDLHQTRVNLFFHGCAYYFSAQRVATHLLNSIFGGEVNSLLFEEIREQRGLAYSIYSAPVFYLESLLVIAGITVGKAAEMIKETLVILEKIKAGDFPDDLLKAAKMLYCSQIYTRKDSLGAMLNEHKRYVLSGQIPTFYEKAEMVQEVSKKDIQALAQFLKLQFTYILGAEHPSKNQEEGE